MKSISANEKKRGRGRPATGMDPTVAVRLPEKVIEAIDKWAEVHAMETRSEAIRHLVELGLAAAPKRGKAK